MRVIDKNLQPHDIIDGEMTRALPCCHFNCVLQPRDLDHDCGLYQSVGVAKLIHS